MERPIEVDHRADIYSLGVVFYEMLTGELPIGRFAPPSQKVQVDVRLDEVVLRSLEREPEKRYQRASEVKTEVESIAIGGDEAATPAPADATTQGDRGPTPRMCKLPVHHFRLSAICLTLDQTPSSRLPLAPLSP